MSKSKFVILFAFLCVNFSAGAQTSQSCPVGSVSINTENSGGVVEGEVLSSGCDFILEVMNLQQHWVDFRVPPLDPGLYVIPNNDTSTTLLSYRVIPPNGSISLRANFAAPGQSVTVLLNSTDNVAEGARYVTYGQALIDLFFLSGVIDSPVTIDLLIEHYPSLRDAISLSTNMRDGFLFLAGGDFNSFTSSMQQAASQGELSIFGQVLRDSGLIVGEDQLIQLMNDAQGTDYLGTLSLIYNSYSSIFSQMASASAGLIVFKAEENATSPISPDTSGLGMTPVTRNADWNPIERDFDGVTMVLVPAGCFDMGGDGWSEDEPIHQQCFDLPFWIDKTEVTRAYFGNSGSSADDNLPVQFVTWFEARDHCEIRGGRLATEAEWEYAARGPESWEYPWGNIWDPNNAIWDRRDPIQGPSNVGSIPAGSSWVGALDLSGNVWEWTSSLHEPYPYDITDGREADTGNRTDVFRAVRGGGWETDSDWDLKSSYREWYSPDTQEYIGIRCVRDFDDTGTASIPENGVQLQSASAPVTRNSDWTPIEADFDGVTMMLVPAGCFNMGSNDYDSEKPVHEQCFDVPFWIDKYEVTQPQFRAKGGIKASANGFPGNNRPVEQITWFEARDFCRLRDARLPTEAEWEYAARGPDNLEYPWGETFVYWNVVYDGDSQGGQTRNVGSIPSGASWVGAMDLSGNVWEWTSSLYQPYPYNATDGREVDSGDTTDNLRVSRGGAWYGFNTDFVRSPYRFGNNPDSNWPPIQGFRCVRDLDDIATTSIFESTTQLQPVSTSTPLVPTTAPTNTTRNSDWTPVEADFNGVAMVLVPAGCFDMGSEDGDPNEQPVHQQCFEAPFWIDKYEVTQEQFRANGGVKSNASMISSGRSPLDAITWHEAGAYCQQRGSRLPTEVEWEYAARGPSNLAYPWGEEFDPNNVIWSDNEDDVQWGGDKLAGVSWVGAHDMAGNVREWTSSKYAPYPYDATDGREVVDGTGSRVRRGGGYYAFVQTGFPQVFRTTYRDPDYPNRWDNNTGFRCIRSTVTASVTVAATPTPLLSISTMDIPGQESTETITYRSITVSYPQWLDLEGGDIFVSSVGLVAKDQGFGIAILSGNDVGLVDKFGPGSTAASLLDRPTFFFMTQLEIVGTISPITLPNGNGYLAEALDQSNTPAHIIAVDTPAGLIVGVAAGTLGNLRQIALDIVGSVVLRSDAEDESRADTDSGIVVVATDSDGTACPIPVNNLQNGIVHFCLGVEIKLPDNWDLDESTVAVDNFALTSREGSSVELSTSVSEISQYYNSDIYAYEVIASSADTSGHVAFDAARHVVTLLEEEERKVAVYNPATYIDLTEDEVRELTYIVTLNNDIMVVHVFTWAPHPSDDMEKIAAEIEEIALSTELVDFYSGMPAFIEIPSDDIVVFNATATSETGVQPRPTRAPDLLPPAVTPVQTVRFSGRVNAATLNVRIGPGPEYDQVAQLTDGAQIRVVGRNDAGTWVQLDAFNQQWIRADFAEITGNILELPVTFVEIGDWDVAGSPTGALAVAETVLRIRGGPGNQYRQLNDPDTVGDGATVDIIGISADGLFYKVNIDSRSGWVNAQFVRITGNVNAVIPVINDSEATSTENHFASVGTPTASDSNIQIQPATTPIMSEQTESLIVGMQAVVYVKDEGLNLRRRPRVDARILQKLPTGTRVTVVGGPRDSDGYVWWTLLTADGSIGWAVEQADQIETLIPQPPVASCLGQLTPRLTIGRSGRVLPGDNNNINSLPLRRSELERLGIGERLGLMSAGTTFTVLGGPVCNDGYMWWYVQSIDIVGWTAEGIGSTYWLEPAP